MQWSACFLTNVKPMTRTVQVSDEEREAILADILDRNALRRRAGLPPYDIEHQAAVEIAELADALFEDRLRPFVEKFYRAINGEPGVVGRMVQHLQVYQTAENALQKEKGIVRPRPVAFDLEKFLKKYKSGRLTDWRGAFSPI